MGHRIYHYCEHSKILQNVAKYCSILILFRIAKRSTFFDKLVEQPSAVCSVLGEISHLEPKLHSFSGRGILTFVQTSIKVAANNI